MEKSNASQSNSFWNQLLRWCVQHPKRVKSITSSFWSDKGSGCTEFRFSGENGEKFKDWLKNAGVGIWDYGNHIKMKQQ